MKSSARNQVQLSWWLCGVLMAQRRAEEGRQVMSQRDDIA